MHEYRIVIMSQQELTSPVPLARTSNNSFIAGMSTTRFALRLLRRTPTEGDTSSSVVNHSDPLQNSKRTLSGSHRRERKATKTLAIVLGKSSDILNRCTTCEEISTADY